MLHLMKHKPFIISEQVFTGDLFQSQKPTNHILEEAYAADSTLGSLYHLDPLGTP
jgi:hypothetical protein